MKYKVAILSLFLSTSVYAESVNTIYNISSNDRNDFQDIALQTIHYFQARETRGPLSEFSYINSHSFLGAIYNQSDFGKNIGVSGVWHTESGWFLGAGYSRFNSEEPFTTPFDRDSVSGSIGYQASERWSLATTFSDSDLVGSSIGLNANYEYKLTGNDYLGVSYSTNEGFDYHDFGVRYFNTLQNGHYLIFDANYVNYDSGDDKWDLRADWYFNRETSISASIDDDEYWRVGARHYFNPNWAIGASYGDGELAVDSTLALNIRAQF